MKLNRGGQQAHPPDVPPQRAEEATGSISSGEDQRATQVKESKGRARNRHRGPAWTWDREVAGWPWGSNLKDPEKVPGYWRLNQLRGPQPSKEEELVDQDQGSAAESTKRKKDGFPAERKEG
ncbi:UNVERIFIED_CONTAM: hypothetical protein K2H54_074929 [Gekko kuhli]